MEINIKNLVYALGALALVSITVFYFTWSFKIPAFELVKREGKITLSGEGAIEVQPDIAFINAEIELQGKEPKQLQALIDKRLNELLNDLKKNGVDEKDVNIVQYNLYPNYTYPQGKPPEIVGYTLRNSLTIKIKNIKNLKLILNRLGEKGVNVITGIDFKVSNLSKYEEEARKKAISDAKTKAEKVAQKLNVKLGRVLNYTEEKRMPSFYAEFPLGANKGGELLKPPSQEVKINVNVTFEIQ